jgi:hypothetical protein
MLGLKSLKQTLKCNARSEFGHVATAVHRIRAAPVRVLSRPGCGWRQRVWKIAAIRQTVCCTVKLVIPVFNPAPGPSASIWAVFPDFERVPPRLTDAFLPGLPRCGPTFLHERCHLLPGCRAHPSLLGCGLCGHRGRRRCALGRPASPLWLRPKQGTYLGDVSFKDCSCRLKPCKGGV